MTRPLALAALLAGCAHVAPVADAALQLEEVVSSPQQLTGVAVSAASGRVFINFPRWVDQPTASVAEVWADGSVHPFPNADWNAWDGTPQTAGDHFVCVQAVYVDEQDQLWIVDPASPAFAGVVPGGAKLLQVDLATGKVVRVYKFDDTIAPAKSYLNDVRTDRTRGRAYLTDSGLGGIIVVDLASGAARRRFDGHPAVSAEPISPIQIHGQPWPGTVASDGIALDAGGELLYFHALTGRTLYRVPAAQLGDTAVTDATLAAKIEKVQTDAAADGLLADTKGNIFITDLEHDAVRVRHADGTIAQVITDPRLSWPDSLALDPAGRLYITASEIQQMPAFNGGVDKREKPFRLFRTKTAAVAP
jgi:sugar lactone lactonase YvrE